MRQLDEPVQKSISDFALKFDRIYQDSSKEMRPVAIESAMVTAALVQKEYTEKSLVQVDKPKVKKNQKEKTSIITRGRNYWKSMNEDTREIIIVCTTVIPIVSLLLGALFLSAKAAAASGGGCFF